MIHSMHKPNRLKARLKIEGGQEVEKKPYDELKKDFKKGISRLPKPKKKKDGQ